MGTPEPATQNDVLLASKAIADGLSKSFDDKLKGTEAAIFRMTKLICDELDKRITDIECKYGEAIRQIKDHYEMEIKRLDEVHSEGMKQLTGLIESIKELPIPQVTVSVPPPRLIKKNISYDEYGRPQTIVEEPGDL